MWHVTHIRFKREKMKKMSLEIEKNSSLFSLVDSIPHNGPHRKQARPLFIANKQIKSWPLFFQVFSRSFTASAFCIKRGNTFKSRTFLICYERVWTGVLHVVVSSSYFTCWYLICLGSVRMYPQLCKTTPAKMSKNCENCHLLPLPVIHTASQSLLQLNLLFFIITSIIFHQNLHNDSL